MTASALLETPAPSEASADVTVPETPVSMPPTPAASEGSSVVGSANDTAQAQSISRKARQMAFLRSRPGPAGAFESGDATKCPEHIKQKLAKNPKLYEFDLQRWIDCDKDYA